MLNQYWTSLRRWGIALFELLHIAWGEYEHDRARYLALAMLYYALVSLVPLLLLAVAALGLLLRYSEVAAELQQQMLQTIEALFGAQVRLTIEVSLASLQNESVIITIISLIGLVFTASVLFRHLRLTFRAIWKYEPPLVSGPLRVVVWTTVFERAIAFLMVLSGGALLLGVLVFITITQWLAVIFNRLPVFDKVGAITLTALSPLLIATITFALLFKFLPPMPIQWRHVWLAAILCGIAWVVTGEALALYGRFFSDNITAYGAIGGLLVVMLWMNIVSQSLFFGAELCKVVFQRSQPPAPADTQSG